MGKKEANTLAFRDRIKEARLKSQLTQKQLGSMIGVANSTIAGYEKGNAHPDENKIIALMKVLGVDANYLWQDEILVNNKTPLTPHEHTHIKKYRACDERGRGMVDNVLDYEYARVQKGPVYLHPATKELAVHDEPAAAGMGNYLSSGGSEMMSFPEGQIPHGADFCIRISGDSMEPKIPDGCIVYVHSCPAIESGEIGIFCLNGDSYCKKLFVDRKRQEIRLESLNPAYSSLEIGAEDYLHTFGRVLGVAEPVEV